MADDPAGPVTQLLQRAAGGSAVPPPGLAVRARRRWQRRRALTVVSAVALVLGVALPTAVLESPERAVTAPAAPSANAFRGDRLVRPVELDGGRLLLEPYGGAASYPRDDAVADYRSAEPARWTDIGATDFEEHVALARVTSQEAGAVLDATPAWVVVYRYASPPYSCPMRTGPLSSPSGLGEDSRWRAFVLPLDGRAPFLWQGQGTGGCQALDAPGVEQARGHLSAPWTETGRDASKATLRVSMPSCGGTIDEVRGPGQPGGAVEVVVSKMLNALPVPCPPTADRSVQVPLSDPDQVLTPAATGLLGQRP